MLRNERKKDCRLIVEKNSCVTSKHEKNETLVLESN